MNIIEIFETFPDQESCINFLEKIRWTDNATCPYCRSTRVTAMPKELRHHCNTCMTSFSVTVGTIFHRTHLPLQKWFLAVYLMLSAKKGIPARQLARDLNVNKNTAWRIAMKVRDAMDESEQRNLLIGIVEADETYMGGKPHKKGPNDKNPRGRGTKCPAVVGMIERNGRVKAQHVKKKKLKAKEMTSFVRTNVDISNAVLYTDEFGGYVGIKKIMSHTVVNHSIWGVDLTNKSINTNTIESFWARLKRGVVGRFHKVSLYSLNKYINEFCYRWNHRKSDNLFKVTIQRGLGVV